MDQLLGTAPSLIRAFFIINKKKQALLDKGPVAKEPRLKLPLSHIKSYYEKEMERLAYIEDKARTTVLGITIAVGLASSGFLFPANGSFYSQMPENWKNLMLIILFLTIIFILLSGFLSLLVMNVGRVYQLSLTDHQSNVRKKVVKEKLTFYIDLNEYIILEKSNLYSASMACLRNGLLCLMILVILGIFLVI